MRRRGFIDLRVSSVAVLLLGAWPLAVAGATRYVTTETLLGVEVQEGRSSEPVVSRVLGPGLLYGEALKAGDVITRIAFRDVSTPGQLEAFLEEELRKGSSDPTTIEFERRAPGGGLSEHRAWMRFSGSATGSTAHTSAPSPAPAIIRGFGEVKLGMTPDELGSFYARNPNVPPGTAQCEVTSFDPRHKHWEMWRETHAYYPGQIPPRVLYLIGPSGKLTLQGIEATVPNGQFADIEWDGLEGYLSRLWGSPTSKESTREIRIDPSGGRRLVPQPPIVQMPIVTRQLEWRDSAGTIARMTLQCVERSYLLSHMQVAPLAPEPHLDFEITSAKFRAAVGK